MRVGHVGSNTHRHTVIICFQIQSSHDIIRQYAASTITGCYHTKQLDLMIHSRPDVGNRAAVLCEGHLDGGSLL